MDSNRLDNITAIVSVICRVLIWLIVASIIFFADIRISVVDPSAKPPEVQK